MKQRIREATNPKPLLIYDGECSFCRYCIEYFGQIAEDSVVCVPYQKVAQNYPEIPIERFEASIQRIDLEGYVSEGAQAAFESLADGGRPGWARLYKWVPGFALLSEGIYRWVAGHRGMSERLCHWLFGKELRPLEYQRVVRLFYKFLAIIYLCAFLSIAVQVLGLIGSEGILPVAEFLATLELAAPEKYWRIPTLFWFSSADWMLIFAPALGIMAALLLLGGKLQKSSLFVMLVLYLSLVQAGQIFMRFQWDLLLLEAGMLGLVLATIPRLGIFLYRWLLFRFMFLAGWVKLASGDPTWANLDALSYHFETQPLPTLLAWYAQQLPTFVLRAATLATLIIELVLPWFIFMPRRIRLVAFFGFVFLQSAIILTGNYNFFNLLTLAICLLLLDDRSFTNLLPKPFKQTRSYDHEAKAIGRFKRLLGVIVVVFVLSISSTQVYIVLGGTERPLWMQRVLTAAEPFHLVNAYGVFAVMTTERNEIIIEGSQDGTVWLPYEFWFKPDFPNEAPTWAAPHQPRLDWQLWFAALRHRPPAWFENMLARLLLGSGDLHTLFSAVPFAGEGPQYIRAKLYRYEFSDPILKEETGDWWQRTYIREYRPTMRIISQPAASEGLLELPN